MPPAIRWALCITTRCIRPKWADFSVRSPPTKPVRSRELAVVSKNRRSLLPYGTIVLEEIIRQMKPSHVEVSALGVREGFLYSLLNEGSRELDPLVVAAEELAILRSRSIAHEREMAEWTGKSMAELRD